MNEMIQCGHCHDMLHPRPCLKRCECGRVVVWQHGGKLMVGGSHDTAVYRVTYNGLRVQPVEDTPEVVLLWASPLKIQGYVPMELGEDS
jgi:hypothetical protein